MLATKPISTICEESDGRYQFEDIQKLSEEVRGAAQKIIAAKHATYYGIGMAMVRITRAIFGNESSILTVSAMLRGEYGQNDIYTGVVNRNGVQKVLSLTLTKKELQQFSSSCETLKSFYQDLGI